MIKTTPMEHQAKALEICAQRPFYAYFMEPGLGKTWTVIAEADILASKKLLDTVVVICPKSIVSVWAEEIEIDETICRREDQRIHCLEMLLWSIANRCVDLYCQ
jgi:hypothetical protein